MENDNNAQPTETQEELDAREKLRLKVLADAHELTSTEDFFRIENWYPVLKDFTFATTFLPITTDEAKAIMKFRELLRLHILMLLQEEQEIESKKPENEQKPIIFVTEEHMEKAHQNTEKMIDPAILETLNQLADKVDAVLKDFNGGAFVRFSTRSPKDAALTSKKMKDMLQKEVLANIENPNEYKDHTEWTQRQKNDIQDMISFTRCCSWSLKVNSGREAINLFLHSQRAYEDIIHGLLYQGEAKFGMTLIIRKWEHFFPDWEFRVFVFNKRINACTQYYPQCFQPHMTPIKQQIKDKIREFHEAQIKLLMPIPSYTMDVVMSPDLKSIQLVEINHLPPTAGVGLFDWDNPTDKEIIELGLPAVREQFSKQDVNDNTLDNYDYDFRILEAPLEDALGEIQQSLEQLVYQLRGYPRKKVKKEASKEESKEKPKDEKRCTIM
mmetsp:Transcript_9101/g.12507  ORF Transcript_9101/g.12507 Transcript_9101/m.12507 type:complete len:441 (+) Transcript_9101:137-1459(+)